MPASPTLDAWVREVVDWHFDPSSGCPFWLGFAAKAGWDPRREVKGFSDLARFGEFQDEWLRGGPVQRWIPKALAGARGERLLRSRALRRVPGRVAARRPRPAVDSEGARRPADLCVRDRRHDRRAENAHRIGGFPHRLRIVQRHAAGRVLPQGIELADARSLGSAPP